MSVKALDTSCSAKGARAATTALCLQLRYTAAQCKNATALLSAQLPRGQTRGQDCAWLHVHRVQGHHRTQRNASGRTDDGDLCSNFASLLQSKSCSAWAARMGERKDGGNPFAGGKVDTVAFDQAVHALGAELGGRPPAS